MLGRGGLGLHWLDIMPFHGLIFLFFISFTKLCSWILATLHYTTTVAMATEAQAANSAAAGLAGAAAAASQAHGELVQGKVGAWVCRCMNALLHECMGWECMDARAGIPLEAQHPSGHLQA